MKKIIITSALIFVFIILSLQPTTSKCTDTLSNLETVEFTFEEEEYINDIPFNTATVANAITTR